MSAWYQYRITQGHDRDDGIDIGTPSRTPLFAPYGGTVVYTGYSDAGGVAFISVPGKGYSWYFLHLNDIAVKQGDTISPGQLIGHSGGGVGDNVLHDGVVEPALDISWYHGHSTGPHSELGIFKGNDIHTLNQAWGNRNLQLDPTSVYTWLQQHAGDYLHTPWPDGSTFDWGAILGGLLGGGLLGGGLLGGGIIPNPVDFISTAFQNGFKALGFSDARNAFWRIGVGAGGALVVIAGITLIGAELVGGAVGDVAKQPIVQTAVKAAKL